MDLLKLLRASLGLAIVAYLGFNFIAMYLNLLPAFVYFENFFWALAYTVAFYASLKRILWPSLLISSFNAGRISDAIITSTGSLHPLALQHTPIALHTFTIIGLSVASMVGRRG
ncbi:MAG: hypothetical protein QXO93_00880 [Acidilobaceae archaeon]